jgi:transaldolase
MSRIFLDSGSYKETLNLVNEIGNLEGQTTNPSLVAKNPEIKEMNLKFRNNDEILAFYKNTIQKISGLIPNGSVSIEVYADKNSTSRDLLKQSEEMYKWIPNSHIKFPTTEAGLEAAGVFINNGGRVNMTLVFSQEQALAVHLATQNAKKGDVFISPFIGRLEDIGQNGLELVNNIVEMYQELQSPVEILAASVRTVAQIQTCMPIADIITAPASLWKDWEKVKSQPSPEVEFPQTTFQPIPFLNLKYNVNWRDININHDLTTAGVQKFADDWNGLITL